MAASLNPIKPSYRDEEDLLLHIVAVHSDRNSWPLGKLLGY